MSRRHIAFDCEGAALAATVDEAPGTCGLLWVSGGNEVRSGAFAGQARLSAKIALAGFPVLRFDRRGVGDSEGVNLGFRESGPDIAAARHAFTTAQPQLTHVVACGNCDAASALMLQGGAGCSALVLANPWTFDADDAPAPPAAIRARYASKLSDPREWLRLARGQVSLGKLAKGIIHAAGPAPTSTSLTTDIASGLARFSGPVRILLAERDRTAQAFLSSWDAQDPRLRLCADASHAFVEADAREWLLAELLNALADEQTRQFDVG